MELVTESNLAVSWCFNQWRRTRFSATPHLATLWRHFSASLFNFHRLPNAVLIQSIKVSGQLTYKTCCKKELENRSTVWLWWDLWEPLQSYAESWVKTPSPSHLDSIDSEASALPRATNQWEWKWKHRVNFCSATSSTYKSRNTLFQHGWRNLHLTETCILFVYFKFYVSLLMCGITHITTLPGITSFNIQ
jgi:hypothetical protein